MTKATPLMWYAAIYGGSAALVKAAGFLLFVWLARSMSVEEYGKFGLLYALQTGLATLAIAGIYESVVGLLKQHNNPQARTQLLESANVAFVVLGAVSTSLVLLLFGLLVFFSDQSLQGLGSTILAGLLMSFLSLQATLVRLEERHVASLSFGLAGPLAGLGGGYIGFLIGHSVASFFLGSAIFLSVSLIGFRLFRVGFYGMASRMKTAYPIFVRIAPFIAIAFLGWLSGYGTNYFVQVFFISDEVARFTFVFSLASILQLVASALNQVWSPRFYKIAHEQPAHLVEKKNMRFFRWQGVAMGSVGGAVIALFPPAIDMVGGNLVAYRTMTVELLLLFAAYVISVPWAHVQNYFLLHGHGRELMSIVFRTSAIGVTIWLLLMALLGPIGIYVGFFVQILVRTVGAVKNAKRRWLITIAWDGVVVGLMLLGVGFLVSRLSG